MRRFGVVVGGVLIVALWGGAATAQRPDWPGRPGIGRWDGDSRMMLGLLVHAAGLSVTQQGQVQQIFASHRAQFQALRAQLRTAHEQVADKLYAGGSLSAGDFASQTQQISQLRDQLSQEALQTALEVRAVLTPEQLAKVSQTRQRLGELRAEMRSLLGAAP